ncbi:hypothetical protein Tco_0920753, partial [Tanacetum coccineum]
MESHVNTLMKDAIIVMERRENILWDIYDMMPQLPLEPLHQEAFEDLVMNFILDQEEKVKQLEEYMGVIGNQKNYELTQTTEDLEPLNGDKFSKDLTEKASFHTPKFVSPKSLYVKYVRTIFPSPPLVRKSTFGFKPVIENNQNVKPRHDAENASPQIINGSMVNMDDPNITMEEYIRLEEEKACRRVKVYNWETTTYGKIWDNEDVHDLGSVETEFPAIVFNDTLTSEAALSCESTVSSLNNDEIDFRISFDESDDEDCTVIFDKNSFSYKIIYVNDLKTDSENDSDKVNMPLLPSLGPTVSYFDDLDYFKDFKKEFPAIVYNDAQTSKLDFLTEPTEQNVLYFNDLFPFNVIYPDDSKTDKDNDDDKIDIEHSSGDMSVIPLSNVMNVDVGVYAQGSN